MKDVKTFLLDLDGTVYLADELIGDMKNTLKTIREKRRIVFLTNNSSKSEKEYKNKLKKLGILDERDFIYTSLMATAEYLREKNLDKDVYVLGSDEIKKEFKEGGASLTTATKAKTAVLTYDRTIDYEKIKDFNAVINSGANYIATHPDNVCPDKPCYSPDIGSFIAMFKVSSNREPDVIIGKPNKLFGEMILKKFGGNPSDYIMVGDRLYTDIAFGINCGFKTMLVLSGETDKEAYSRFCFEADYVLKDLNEVKKYL